MSSDPDARDRQRWLELKELFNAAVERPRAGWAALVSSVRERDSDLADELQRLLSGHDDSLIHVRNLDVEYLAPGAALGPYIVTELIGEGGMGQVYRARDERLGRDVAIKVLPPGLTHDSDRRMRMEREARAMGMLNHPNIVTVYDIGDHKGAPFIVSELLEGRTLRADVAAAAGSGRAVTASDAVGIAVSVADALGAAHRRNIVHRDVKPENIFLTSDGRIKVLDFGIAKLVDGAAASDGTVAGAMIGTLGYMSPEQVRGETPCAQTDVYACGVVLYELLSGTRPYAGPSQAALIGSILHEPPPPLTGRAPALSALVSRCLDKRIEARFADGAELAAALRALPAIEAGTDRPSERSVWRRPGFAALVVALLAGAAIVGALTWRQDSTDRLPDRAASLPAPALAGPVSSAPPATAAPQLQPREVSSPSGAPSSGAARPDRPKAQTSAAAADVRSPVAPDPAPAPAVAPLLPAVTTLDGVWTVSEQIAEDINAIECAAAGALQLSTADGLLDGTLRLKRDCKDAKRLTTDSTETTSALSAGTSAANAVSFVTRVVDEGLVTTCRYSGQLLGNSRGTMAGDVTCEARSVGLSAVLALRGSWRANKTAP